MRLTNVQIVNGGQTTSALFEASQRDPDRVREVLVLLRIYETRQDALSGRIAEATNSQTPIRSRDLRANDAVQKKIEDMLAASGYFWERKTGSISEAAAAKNIDMVTAGQSILAYWECMPEIAKKDKARVVGDLYDDIFDEDKLSIDRILVPYKLFRSIESRKKTVQKDIKSGKIVKLVDLVFIDGTYHILYAIGSIAERRGGPKDEIEYTSTLIDDASEAVARAVIERFEIK